LMIVEAAGVRRSDMAYSVLRPVFKPPPRLPQGPVTENCHRRVTKPQFMTCLDVRPKKPVIRLLRKRYLTTYFKRTVRRR
jgi:hypothetical protein